MENPQEQTQPRRRLGRGLNALLGSSADDESEPVADGAADGSTSGAPPVHDEQRDLGQIDVNLISRNPFQPRKDFEDAELKELADSIRQHGILQPILVREHDGAYQLIAGERRWLAAKQAGLTTVPCQVRDMDDKGVYEAAIEENLKRKDLNALEKAQAFKDYLDRFGSTIEELAKQLSLDRSTVSNMLRLLELAEPVKQALLADRITNGHARALLALEEPDQVALCQQIEAESLSVRKTEAAVRAMVRGETVPFKPKEDKPGPPEPSRHVQSLQQQLQDHLGAKVEIKLKTKDSGKVIIHFASNDEFEGIVRTLRRAA